MYHRYMADYRVPYPHKPLIGEVPCVKLTKEYDLKVGIEVGVYKGDLSEAILQFTAIKQLYLMDNWMCEDDFGVYGDQEYIAGMVRDGRRGDILIEKVRQRMAKWGNRVKILRYRSPEGAKLFRPETFDWVFLDTIHAYQQVLEEIKAWAPTIKPGGFIMGDDYHYRFPGVRKAVDEMYGDRTQFSNKRHWWVQLEAEDVLR